MTREIPLPPPPIGWPLLQVPDRNGEMTYPGSLAESARQQLRVLLSTRPGEQLMRPGYGAGLTEFLGQPNNVTTRKRIYDRVAEAIGRWETRITIDRINVDEVPGNRGWLRVEVAYRLRRTGQMQSIGVSVEVGN